MTLSALLAPFSMIALLDAYYREPVCITACIVIADWNATTPVEEVRVETPVAGEYIPGEFYKRELPGIREALRQLRSKITVVVIDGYVWLEPGRPGLGMHLYPHLDSGIAVIGVAKSAFKGAPGAVQICRGASLRPLYVTVEGVDAQHAAAHIRGMPGAHRIPDMLRRVDQLSKRH